MNRRTPKKWCNPSQATVFQKPAPIRATLCPGSLLLTSAQIRSRHPKFNGNRGRKGKKNLAVRSDTPQEKGRGPCIRICYKSKSRAKYLKIYTPLTWLLDLPNRERLIGGVWGGGGVGVGVGCFWGGVLCGGGCGLGGGGGWGGEASAKSFLALGRASLKQNDTRHRYG